MASVSSPAVSSPKARVTPLVAAAYVGVIAYVWTEAIVRYVATSTTALANLVLWSERDGDIAAMWLTMAVVAILAFLVAFVVLRRRTSVGSLYGWTMVLVVSAVIAPLIGEIGTPIGI